MELRSARASKGGPGRKAAAGGRGGDEAEVWVPCTKLGRLVKEGLIKSLEQVYLYSLKVKEYQVRRAAPRGAGRACRAAASMGVRAAGEPAGAASRARGRGGGSAARPGEGPRPRLPRRRRSHGLGLQNDGGALPRRVGGPPRARARARHARHAP